MVLEDPIHCMHVVEHLQQHDLVEIRETVEVLRDDPAQAAVSPLLVMNEFRAVARCHDVTSFRLVDGHNASDRSYWQLAFGATGYGAQAAHESQEVRLASEITRDGGRARRSDCSHFD